MKRKHGDNYIALHIPKTRVMEHDINVYLCIKINAIDLVFIWGRPCVQLQESKSNLEQHNGMCQVDHSWLFHLPFPVRGNAIVSVLQVKGRQKDGINSFHKCVYIVYPPRGESLAECNEGEPILDLRKRYQSRNIELQE